MIKALSLAAALALLPLSASLAQEEPGPSEAAIEAAAEAFEARMEAFGERAEAISDDETLSEEQREERISALWAEYQPDVNAFTATVTQYAAGVAGEALAEVDVEAIVAEALAGVDIGAVTAQALGSMDFATLTVDTLAGVADVDGVRGAMAGAQGMVTNGSWASNDPEHMATYGLVADYAVGEALDAADEAGAGIEAAATGIEVEVEAESDEG